tara:strand:+ start:1664 stop:1843 length:180 start_codon:yes stop_codon:yes gene_type:complete
MMRKWRDWFTDMCDVCEEDLTKEGMVYIIKQKLGICADCYESVRIYLVDVEIEEIGEEE